MSRVSQLVYITEGYECQEFNGVFMLAFSTATAAVRFALILQQLLMVADWPDNALRLASLQLQTGDEQQVRARALPRVGCKAARATGLHVQHCLVLQFLHVSRSAPPGASMLHRVL